ncbi:MAG: hypothetical protein GY774_20875 [Planctomycetes bacterium]|nr:hypothetical protein [Planctomycetota bacterium]
MVTIVGLSLLLGVKRIAHQLWSISGDMPIAFESNRTLRKRNARLKGAHKVFTKFFKLSITRRAGDAQLYGNVTIDFLHEC